MHLFLLSISFLLENNILHIGSNWTKGYFLSPWKIVLHQHVFCFRTCRIKLFYLNIILFVFAIIHLFEGKKAQNHQRGNLIFQILCWKGTIIFKIIKIDVKYFKTINTIKWKINEKFYSYCKPLFYILFHVKILWKRFHPIVGSPGF